MPTTALLLAFLTCASGDPSALVDVDAGALGLESALARPRCARTWRGERAGSALTLDLRVLPREPGRIEEPELAVELLRTTRRLPIWCCSRYPGEDYDAALFDEADANETRLGCEERRLRADAELGVVRSVRGAYGCVLRCGVATGPTYVSDSERNRVLVGARCVLAGLLPEHAWIVELDVAPPLPEAEMAQLETLLLRSVRVTSALRAPRWSDAELAARWQRLHGNDVAPTPRIARTEHFAIVGDASCGDSTLRFVERQYERVRAVLRFEESADRRELPIFLFRTPTGYECVESSWHGKTLGLAWHDTCATWYRGSRDPILAHEIVHQLQRNRCFQVGGSRWFREGLAEALSRPPRELRLLGRHAARYFAARQCSWSEQSSAWSLEGKWSFRGTELRAYDCAGIALDFLLTDPSTSGSFLRFAELAAACAPADGDGARQAARAAFGRDLVELEALWRHRCARESRCRERCDGACSRRGGSR